MRAGESTTGSSLTLSYGLGREGRCIGGSVAICPDYEPIPVDLMSLLALVEWVRS
jgi:hypothetical protein